MKFFKRRECRLNIGHKDKRILIGRDGNKENYYTYCVHCAKFGVGWGNDIKWPEPPPPPLKFVKLVN